jgi:hypothetical protein
MPHMSSLGLFEILLAVAGVVALGLLRSNAMPSSLFWAVGIGSITLAAALGALFHAGFGALKPAYDTTAGLALTVGIVALVFGALFSLLIHVGPGIALAVTAAAVILLVVLASGGLPRPDLMPVLAAIALGLIALLGFRGRPRAARWLLLGVAAAALAALGREGALGFLRLHPLNLYHLFLAGALLCFGLTARTAGR